MKGLHCNIYKWSLGDCSNGGISSKAKEVTLVGDNIDQIFEADEDHPAVKIVKRFLSGRD